MVLIITVFAGGALAAGTCGNGVVEMGEPCDDGNIASGDCCTATCQFEPPGISCASDGDLCSSDICDGAG